MSRGFNRGKGPEQSTIAYAQAETNEAPGGSGGAAPPNRELARAKGFTGNQCSTCGSINMVVAGHCEVCTDCGTTTGCS